MAIQVPKVLDCSATECSYNTNKSCHALAITVGDSSCAMCDTYFSAAEKGGAAGMAGSVGACKENDCRYNNSLECSAPGIHVANHMGHADCATYNRR